jgi:1,2-phenylacetyl-CoA epoxidase catalytic subunit
LLTARVVVLLALRHSNWVGKAPTPVTSLMLGSFEPDLVRLASSRCLAESSIADP